MFIIRSFAKKSKEITRSKPSVRFFLCVVDTRGMKKNTWDHQVTMRGKKNTHRFDVLGSLVKGKNYKKSI